MSVESSPNLQRDTTTSNVLKTSQPENIFSAITNKVADVAGQLWKQPPQPHSPQLEPQQQQEMLAQVNVNVGLNVHYTKIDSSNHHNQTVIINTKHEHKS